MITPPRLRLAVLVTGLVAALTACNRPAANDARSDTTVPASERPADASIQTAIQARLYADDSIRGEDIDVRTENGVVTLQGAVASEAVEQQALTIARGVEGVTRVEDQLTIEPREQTQGQPTAGTGYRSAAANKAGWITTKIHAQYFVAPEIKPWNIDVTTGPDGVVELRGVVDSEQAKSEAVRIARATDGVTRVEDHLRVRRQPEGGDEADAGERDISDVWLTTKIQAKYFLDDDVKGRDIDVTTQDGLVTLSGTVDSELERRRAIAIARNTDGVRDVRDQLRMAEQASSRRQPEARGTAGRDIVAGIQDGWITTKIQSQYFLDPDVKGYRIDVDARKGVVTLSGTVASAARRELAEQIARETQGVTRVINRLTVEAER
jgi:osmotically-inducible protein OsmY